MIFLTEIFSDIIELTSDLEKNKGQFFLNTISKHFGNQFTSEVRPSIQQILEERAADRSVQPLNSSMDQY